MPEGFEIGLHAKFDLRCQFPPVNKPGKSGAYTQWGQTAKFHDFGL